MSDKENISKGCCVPQRAQTSNAKIDFVDLVAADTTRPKTVHLPETSKAILGTGSPRILNDGEELRAGSRISAFEITQTTITNRSFDDFVSATGYVTEAERFGWSFVFWSDVPKSIGISQGLVVPSGGGELRAQIGGKLMVLAAKNGPGMPTIL